MINEFRYTPYNKKADEAMSNLADFDCFSFYQENLQIIFDYIEKLESIIYGYTE